MRFMVLWSAMLVCATFRPEQHMPWQIMGPTLMILILGLVADISEFIRTRT